MTAMPLVGGVIADKQLGDWLSSLDSTTRAALIAVVGVIVSGLMSALIALFGYIFTARNQKTLAANSAQITQNLKMAELKHSARIKIAEARIDWIEKFRGEASELYAIQYEINSIRGHSKSETDAAKKVALKLRLRELFVQQSQLKARLFMRINPNSPEDDERALEKLLKQNVALESDKAQTLRKELRELTRSILNREWNKAKTEINT